MRLLMRRQRLRGGKVGLSFGEGECAKALVRLMLGREGVPRARRALDAEGEGAKGETLTLGIKGATPEKLLATECPQQQHEARGSMRGWPPRAQPPL